MITHGIIIFLTLTAYAIEAEDISGEDGDTGDGLGLIRQEIIDPLFPRVESGNSTDDGFLTAGALKNGISRPKRECTGSGCHKGYCWSYCSIGAQWCYTSKSYSQSYRYEKCSSDSDCNCWWSCAGPCSV